MADEIRNLGLYAIGEIIYVAASPDIADGLSDVEFNLLVDVGPGLVQEYIFLQKIMVIPEQYALPDNFSTHFEHNVLPGLAKIRQDKQAREYLRSEIYKVLTSPENLAKLYTVGGDTYSDMIDRALEKSTKKDLLTPEGGGGAEGNTEH